MTCALASRILALAAAAVLLAAPVGAQVRYPFSLTLYDQPDYRGGSVTFYGDNANIGSTGFSTRARSAQIRGTWRLCEGGGYRNRCEVLNLNIRDLEAYGFAGRVGSAQLLSGDNTPQPPPATAPAVRYVPPPAAAYQVPGPEAFAPAAPPQRPAPRSAPELPPAPRAALTPRPAPQAPPRAAPAPQAVPPAYVAPGPSRAYEPIPEPPAVDAPLDAPSRFGRTYDRPPAVQPPPIQMARAPEAPALQPPAATASPAYAAGAAQGGSAVFFPSPTLRGADVAAWTPRAADRFCAAQGFSGAVYFDQSLSLPRSVDVDGYAMGEGPVLRDVLCRR